MLTRSPLERSFACGSRQRNGALQGRLVAARAKRPSDCAIDDDEGASTVDHEPFGLRRKRALARRRCEDRTGFEQSAAETKQSERLECVGAWTCDPPHHALRIRELAYFSSRRSNFAMKGICRLRVRAALGSD